MSVYFTNCNGSNNCNEKNKVQFRRLFETYKETKGYTCNNINCTKEANEHSNQLCQGHVHKNGNYDSLFITPICNKCNNRYNVEKMYPKYDHFIPIDKDLVCCTDGGNEPVCKLQFNRKASYSSSDEDSDDEGINEITKKVGNMDVSKLCGAKTSKGTKCTKPASSCPYHN